MFSNLVASSPTFFEKACIDLMFAIGYGYSKSESRKVTQYSKNGEIDGIIYTDKLGLGKFICKLRNLF